MPAAVPKGGPPVSAAAVEMKHHLLALSRLFPIPIPSFLDSV